MGSIKELQALWLRSAASFSTVHQELENEIVRMRDRKISQEIIDKKDFQIEQLVNFYNQADELIQAFRHELLNQKIQNHFLTEMLAKKVSIDEILQYKPCSKVILVKNQTGDHTVISSINED